MAKAIFLDSVAGVAGDMFTAAFVDAGLVTVEELDTLPLALGLSGVRITAETVIRASVSATKLNVEADSDSWKDQFSHAHEPAQAHHHHHEHEPSTNLVLDQHAEHWHVHYGEIDALVRRSTLEEATRETARSIFRVLGEAEASVHGIALEKAAFHELGTVDSIMDVVMAAYCVNKVGAENVFATPIKAGRGSINIAHGKHPVPPPATSRLLMGLPVAPTPTEITAENIELSTPTGVAIIRQLGPIFVKEMPSGVITAEGRGSGTKDLGNYPNVFRLVVIETAAHHGLPYLTDRVVEIACNVDDDTAEHLAWMCEQLLSKGALDVWQTPGTGKKGRSMG